MKSKLFCGLFLIASLSSSSIFGQIQKKNFEPLPIPIKADNTQFVSTAEFTFTDGRGGKWIAPIGTQTDGASIPQICMSFIGPPMADERRAAALVHDAYCAIANQGKPSYHKATWQDVHKMFYEACIAGGTSEVEAKIMYSAVWMFGPRWTYFPKQDYYVITKNKDNQKIAKEAENAVTSIQEAEIKDLNIKEVPENERVKQFEEMVKFIKRENPDISELDETMKTVSSDLKLNKKAKPIN